MLKPDQSLSLFSFLSILLCLIGALFLLLTVSIINREMLRKKSFALEQRQKEYVRIAGEIKNRQDEINGLNELVTQALALEQYIDDLDRELSNARQSRFSAEQSEKEIIDLAKQIRDARKRIEAKRQTRDDLERRLEEQRAEPPDSQYSTDRNIVVLPGLNVEKQDEQFPIFIECSGDELILHPEKITIPMTEIKNNISFRNELKKTRQSPNGILVFLIRPNAVAVFEAAEKIIRNEKIRYGRLPLPGFGSVNFDQILNQAHE